MFKSVNSLAHNKRSVYNFPMKDLVSICFESEFLALVAAKFAQKNALNISTLDEASSDFILYYKEDITELIDRQANTAIHVDFISGSLAHRRKYGGGQGQAIAKAIGIKKYRLPLSVLDVTAGLAKDAFVLACLGCSVKMIERNPIVAELVNTALKLAENNDNFEDIKQQGFSLLQTDAVDYLKKLDTKSNSHYPDIIYLDPMYPQRKKSASVRKNMQILQKLLSHKENTQPDETELFNLALKFARKRVVVKRPKTAPTLTDKIPSMSIQSKITRYDVYVLT